jgi:hypothetical protein
VAVSECAPPEPGGSLPPTMGRWRGTLPPHRTPTEHRQALASASARVETPVAMDPAGCTIAKPMIIHH